MPWSKSKVKRKCPKCKTSDGIRLFIWGDPVGIPDEKKYIIGGCLIDGTEPKYKCITCGWEGN